MKHNILLPLASALLLVAAPFTSAPPTEAQTIPQIQGVSQPVALPGQTLTIRGQNFNWSISAPDIHDQVTLNGAGLPVLAWSSTQITVGLPKSAASGNLVVTADNGASANFPLKVGPRGLDLLASSGKVHPLMGAEPYAGPTPAAGAVALAATPDGMGYWVLQGNGTLSAYGDAKKLEPASPASTPVGLAMNRTGQGGWILSQNGTVTPVGNAQALGNGQASAAAIAAAPNGQGYWVLSQSGTVSGFGSVKGSWTAPGPAVAMAADPAGGFWVLSASGAVTGLDGATTYGNMTVAVNTAHATPAAIAATPDGHGYYLLSQQGTIYAWGDAVLPQTMPPSSLHSKAMALSVVGPYQPYGLNNFVYWFPTGTLNQYLQYQSTMGTALNDISPHWFWVNSNGSVGGPNASITQLVAQMQAHGLKVVPMFGRSFNNQLGPLASPSQQQQMADSIAAAVKKWNLNGANLDFEGLPPGSSGYLDAFVQKLRAALGSHLLTVDVYPNWAPYVNSQGQPQPANVDSIYNYHFLSQIADIVIMAYPMSFQPGPLSSLVKDSAIMNYVLHGATGSGSEAANPNHVFFGIPGYGRIWLNHSAYGLEGGQPIPKLAQTLAQAGASPQYSATRGENTASFTVPYQTPSSTLQSGDTGAGVVMLQSALNQVLKNPLAFHAQTAVSTPSLPIGTSGVFTSSTTAAVYAFQLDWGVSGDAHGVYGSATASKLSWIHHNTTALSGLTIPATAWYESAQANVAHAKIIQHSGLAGVSLWSMGQADPNYFSAMANGVNLAANAPLQVALSHPTLYRGVSTTETVTVTQGSGFPIANLNIGLMGQSQTTNAQGQAQFIITPASAGTLPVTVQDPAGGTIASATATVANAVISRDAGQTRFGTARQLSHRLYRQSRTVVLTTANNFPDALAGAPLATALHAPILLTSPGSLTGSTLARMENLGASQVILLGGHAAISASVAQTLRQDGFLVTRYAGQTRFGTAAQIADAVGSPSNTAVMAAAQDYPDALSIAPIAAQQGWPLLLTGATGNIGALSASTQASLKQLNIHTVYLIGSTRSIPHSITTALQQTGVHVIRLSGGHSVYGTNVAVLSQFASDLKPLRLFVATGQNFPDALASGPVAAALKAPLLLVPGLGSLTTAESAWLSSHRGQVGHVTIAGGPAAVSPGLQTAIQNLLP